MQRFFVPPQTLTGREVRIEGETARQISRVLRMQPGDQVCLLDGSGLEYVVRLTGFAKDYVTGEVVEKARGRGEPAVAVTLYLSLLNKADKFEWALQKCTEIGVTRFVPVKAGRSISDMPGTGKRERWERIIQEAAEQSGRSLLPSIETSVTFAQAVEQESRKLQQSTKGGHIAIIPVPGARCSLGEALREVGADESSISIFIGPEGGFTEEEVAAAEKVGVLAVTLGPRILRAETAAVVSVTMVLYALGEMGS